MSSSLKETLRLQQLSEESTQKAQELAGKVLDVENDYREKMSLAEGEIREMKSRVKKEVEGLRAAVLAKAKAEAQRIIAQSLNAKEEIRCEIEDQMKERSMAFSKNVLREVFSSDELEMIHDGFLENIFKELTVMDKGRLQSVDLSGPDDNVIEVKTSRPMSAQQIKKLEVILSAKLEKQVTIHETIDTDVMAGVVITMGSFIIDGSFAERFRRAADKLK